MTRVSQPPVPKWNLRHPGYEALAGGCQRKNIG
jgi:hypothetical protein